MSYKDGRPILPATCTAWQVEVGEETYLMIWSRDATITDVANYCKALYSSFSVGPVDVGTFRVAEIVEAYRSDARQVDQEGEVHI